ncbi:MAG: hypothetical protein ACYS8W_08645 [Planctomycetota bacterium]
MTIGWVYLGCLIFGRYLSRYFPREIENRIWPVFIVGPGAAVGAGFYAYIFAGGYMFRIPATVAAAYLCGAVSVAAYLWLITLNHAPAKFLKLFFAGVVGMLIIVSIIIWPVLCFIS